MLERTYSDNGVPYYQFPVFREFDFLRHGIFTRQGGVSKPPFGSLNMGLSVGDHVERVSENREIVSRIMGGGRLRFVRQVHGDGVYVVSSEEARPGEASPPVKADALITDMRGQNLVIQVADCQAVLLVDRKLQIVANVHSGWRGSIKNIVGKTTGVMKNRFGCRPENIFAGIGPSLGPCCAEFIHYKKEIPKKFWSYKDEDKRFDFWAISRDQLGMAGVPEDHILTAGLCTRCLHDQFFSYRKHGQTGRFAAVIGLKQLPGRGKSRL